MPSLIGVGPVMPCPIEPGRSDHGPEIKPFTGLAACKSTAMPETQLRGDLFGGGGAQNGPQSCPEINPQTL